MNKYAVKSLISFYGKPLDLHYHISFFSFSTLNASRYSFWVALLSVVKHLLKNTEAVVLFFKKFIHVFCGNFLLKKEK